MTIEVVDTKGGKYFIGEHTSGSTTCVMLRRKNKDGSSDYASCKDILIWEDSMADEYLFDEWVECAMEGEQGYWAMITEETHTVMYGE